MKLFQLVTLPSILCLDEPTTGLDAFTAFSLLQTLSRLAQRNNRTVILSIHQPRSDAFLLFSRLVLLAPGGRVVYSGLRSRCLDWFRTAGLDDPPEGVNVLDWMVDLATLDTRTPEKEEASRTRVNSLVGAWADREEGWDLDEDVKRKGSITKTNNDESRGKSPLRRDQSDSNLQLAPAVSRAVSDIMSIHALHVSADKRPGWVKQTYILTRRFEALAPTWFTFYPILTYIHPARAWSNVVRDLGQSFGERSRIGCITRLSSCSILPQALRSRRLVWGSS